VGGSAARYHLLRRYGLSHALREAIRSDNKVRAEAEEELRLASAIDPNRCVVSAEYAAVLREALA
jgi:hypothetical protein